MTTRPKALVSPWKIVTEHLDKHAARVDSSVESLTGQLTLLTQQLTALQTKMSELQTKLSDLDATVTAFATYPEEEPIAAISLPEERAKIVKDHGLVLTNITLLGTDSKAVQPSPKDVTQ